MRRRRSVSRARPAPRRRKAARRNPARGGHGPVRRPLRNPPRGLDYLIDLGGDAAEGGPTLRGAKIEARRMIVEEGWDDALVMRHTDAGDDRGEEGVPVWGIWPDARGKLQQSADIAVLKAHFAGGTQGPRSWHAPPRPEEPIEQWIARWQGGGHPVRNPARGRKRVRRGPMRNPSRPNYTDNRTAYNLALTGALNRLAAKHGLPLAHAAGSYGGSFQLGRDENPDVVAEFDDTGERLAVFLYGSMEREPLIPALGPAAEMRSAIERHLAPTFAKYARDRATEDKKHHVGRTAGGFPVLLRNPARRRRAGAAKRRASPRRR